MGIVQRGGDRTEDAGDLADRQTRQIPPNQMSAIRALDIVHRDPQLALVLSGRPTLAALGVRLLTQRALFVARRSRSDAHQQQVLGTLRVTPNPLMHAEQQVVAR
jgi:hypothetical protein